MKAHYLPIVKASDAAFDRSKRRITVDPRTPYTGAMDDMTYLVEPGNGAGLISACCVLYSCEESRYYRDKELLSIINNACSMFLRSSHPDGTIDFLATNYYTPATFEIQGFARGYKVFIKYMSGTEDELEAQKNMKKALDLLSDGCLNGGFHTPNHRWVECGAMLMSHNILNKPALVKKVESYLSEGIDCDEYGEFTERSMGSYNPINVNSMLTMAEEGGYTELYRYAKMNLDLTFKYLDGDGTLFTKNSRRLDSGYNDFFPAHAWYYLYLWAGEKFGDLRYLKFASDMFESALSRGSIPAPLWLYLEKPQLKTLEPDFSGVSIPDTYHAFYPNSNILRVRKEDFSYTLICRNPDFLHIKFGSKTMTVRMCSSFFAVAQFAPEKIEKTDTGYRVRFSGHGEYKGLFPEPPPSPEWDKMDHSLRPVLHSCDLDYTVDITDREDGFDMHILLDNTPFVPFKLEFVIPPDTRLETESMIMDTYPGGTIAVKYGDMRLEDVKTANEVTVRGLFAKHMYHQTMRGSIPQNKEAFTVYSTGFSPIDAAIRFDFTRRMAARAMDRKI
ncbi:MAG: hypothetical protein IJC48_06755 [Clostridia bacterium]|nr:hypothetical protein [Clostridia bacterium]